jgi:polyhydroxyalkanoate synthesis regulator phasin
MENIQLTQAETHFRGWEQDRSNLITRTKDEIKKQHTIVRNAEATLDRLSRQLEALENQIK